MQSCPAGDVHAVFVQVYVLACLLAWHGHLLFATCGLAACSVPQPPTVNRVSHPAAHMAIQPLAFQHLLFASDCYPHVVHNITPSHSLSPHTGSPSLPS